jgi:hypothetical protein
MINRRKKTQDRIKRFKARNDSIKHEEWVWLNLLIAVNHGESIPYDPSKAGITYDNGVIIYTRKDEPPINRFTGWLRRLF